jgi:hypothetical protein
MLVPTSPCSSYRIVLHSGAEATRQEDELMMEVTLGATVVDDLFGIWPVVPTSRCPNANVGMLDGKQRNVVVTVIKPVPPRNVVEILLHEVALPPQVVVLPRAVRGR